MIKKLIPFTLGVIITLGATQINGEQSKNLTPQEAQLEFNAKRVDNMEKCYDRCKFYCFDKSLHEKFGTDCVAIDSELTFPKELWREPNGDPKTPTVEERQAFFENNPLYVELRNKFNIG